MYYYSLQIKKMGFKTKQKNIFVAEGMSLSKSYLATAGK
jgi:hypothetical protein